VFQPAINNLVTAKPHVASNSRNGWVSSEARESSIPTEPAQ
jgi:hypothetical protein